MMSDLQQKLFEAELRYRPKTSSKTKKQRLRVFYGWTKLGKVRKKEAISVIYENEAQREDKVERSIKRFQNTCFVREQTEDEKQDAAYSNRVFTEYSVFLDDKRISGSLEAALKVNNEADKRNVSVNVRKQIEEALRKEYMSSHPGYKEPYAVQTFFNFDFE